jgi:hypothetical protein
MKSLLPLLTLLGLLAGCGVADFAAKQAEWNRQNGMGSMNGPPTMGGSGDQSTADQDAETLRNIKHGENVENAEAAKAGFGPSPTDGMSCTSTSSVTGSANNATTVSHTSCHN